MELPILTGKVAKNSKEQIQISLTVFKGFKLLDARIYTLFSDGVTFGPTSNGLTLQLNRVPDLIGSLQEALTKARELGLITEVE